MMNDDLNSRKGIFSISMDLIRNYGIALGIQVMSEVFVARAEHMLMNDEIVYYAYSKHFEPVKVGQAIPKYSVVMDGAYLTVIRFDKING